MQRYILVRVLQAILCMVAVALIVFLLGRLSGDPRNLMLGIEATPEQYEAVGRQLGLDQPAPVQFGIFLLSVVKMDFGKSIRTGVPVTELVFGRLPATFELGLAAILFSVLVGVPVGVYSAVRRGGGIDFAARMFAVLGQALPSFWLGIVLMYVFAVGLHWLPTSGSGGIEHFVLPTLTLGWYITAGLMRLTRSSMLEVLDSEYVKLARIKGVSEFKVVWKHAFKNALLPVLTYSAVIWAVVLSGAVVVETVFAWPGTGMLLIESVSFRDYPVVQTLALMFSAIYIAANLMADLMYCYVNPKIKYA